MKKRGVVAADASLSMFGILPYVVPRRYAPVLQCVTSSSIAVATASRNWRTRESPARGALD